MLKINSKMARREIGLRASSAVYARLPQASKRKCRCRRIRSVCLYCRWIAACACISDNCRRFSLLLHVALVNERFALFYLNYGKHRCLLITFRIIIFFAKSFQIVERWPWSALIHICLHTCPVLFVLFKFKINLILIILFFFSCFWFPVIIDLLHTLYL